MRVFKSYLASLCLLVSISLAAGAIEASLAVKTEEPGNVYTTKKELAFSLDKNIKTADIEYEVKDWQKNNVAKGIWKNPETDKLKLESLPRGYYTMTLKSSSQEFSGYVPFSIVTDPSERTVNYDGFFALNVAQTWTCAIDPRNKRQPANPQETMADLSALSGASMIREMTTWEQIIPSPYEYIWNNKYMNTSRLLAERGVRTCVMFESAPSWAKTNSRMLPDNLFALYDFTSKSCISPTFKDSAFAWEFWNEEDLDRPCPEPVWDFAACQKVAYLGFKAANPQLTVLNGSLCRPIDRFGKLAFENDWAYYFDKFNFHTYDKFAKYPKLIENLKNVLEYYNAGNKAIWFTESGSSYEGNGKLDSYFPWIPRAVEGNRKGQRKEHDEEQELILSEFFVKSQILMQSLGIERNFSFILSAYNERGGGKAWGMLRFDYTAKPAFVAYANMTAILGNAKYIGRYEAGEGINAFIYETPDKQQLLVFWSESELDKAIEENPEIKIADLQEKSFTIDVNTNVLESFFLERKLLLTDMMGKENKLEAPKNGKIQLKSTRFPSYVKGLSNLTPSSKDKKSLTSNPAIDIDKTIVFKVRLSNDFTTEAKTFTSMNNPKGKLTLDVYNFSNEVKHGKITFTGRGTIDKLPETIEIEAMNKISLVLNYIPTEFNSTIEFGGRFNGNDISRIKIPVICTKILSQTSSNTSMDFKNPERWRKNSSGDMKISHDDSENAIRFDVSFNDKKNSNYWIYPEYPFNANESMKDALAVSFEIKAEQKDGNNKYAHANLMLIKDRQQETGQGDWIAYNAPEEKWKFIVIDLQASSVKPEDIRMIRVGMGPNSEKLTFWIRDMKIYYRK